MSEREKIFKRIFSIWGKADEICREKRNRAFELRKLCQEAGDFQCPKIDLMPKAKKNSSFVENSVVRNIDIYENAINRLELEIKEILSIRAYIDSWVSFLETDERKIIIMRYKDGLSWDYIPDIIHKSRMQCFRIHNRVIKKYNDSSMFENIMALPQNLLGEILI